MKHCLRAGLAVLVVLLFGMALTPRARASVLDFTVTSFKSDITLSNADPQGELHIVEHIDVHFNDYNHGIERAIPLKYKDNSLQLALNSVKHGDGTPIAYSEYNSNGNHVYRIGNPN